MGLFSTIFSNVKNMKKAKQYRNMGKEGLLALNDDDFYDAIDCLCEDAVYDIQAPTLLEEQILVYSLNSFMREVNNGGLCQFFVNSSSECAPFISKALEAIGALELKNLFDKFIEENNIDVNDLSSFKISSFEEFAEQTKRYDFDSFDNQFYDDENFYQQMIDYSRKHIEQLMQA